MLMITSNIHGTDTRGRLLRRSLARYVNLGLVLTFRSISTAVFKRFPTMQHVIDAGFMTEAENKEYEDVKTEYAKFWVPCVWFANLLSKARQEGRIYQDLAYHNILKELMDFRAKCGMLFSYNWISIPLVYTQVVTVAVYVFFISTLISRQFLDVDKSYPGHEVDLYVPVFTIFQFFFYFGWLKVAEQLINPFGDDDDDFEANFLIDRHFEISMIIIDNMYLSHPKLEKDKYWNNPNPDIPYTVASAEHNIEVFLGSTVDMSVRPNDMHFVEENPKHATGLHHGAGDPHSEAAPLLENQVSIDTAPTRGAVSRGDGGSERRKHPRRSILSKFKRKHSGYKEKSVRINIQHDNVIVEEENEDSEQKSDLETTKEHYGGGIVDIEAYPKKSTPSADESLAGDGGDTAGSPGQTLTVQPLFDDKPLTHQRSADDTMAKCNSMPTLLDESPGLLELRRPNSLYLNEVGLLNQSARSQKGGKIKKKKNFANFFKRSELAKKNKKLKDAIDERENAQGKIWDINMSRKASPGNWPMYKHSPWGSDPNVDIHSYMIDDVGKKSENSPTFSLKSYGSSVPSPKLLRFAYSTKRGKDVFFDNESLASYLPSLYGYDDDGTPLLETPTEYPKRPQDMAHWPPDFYHPVSPSPASTPVTSMPYTEDVKQRLGIVSTGRPAALTKQEPSGNQGQYAPILGHTQLNANKEAGMAIHPADNTLAEVTNNSAISISQISEIKDDTPLLVDVSVDPFGPNGASSDVAVDSLDQLPSVVNGVVPAGHSTGDPGCQTTPLLGHDGVKEGVADPNQPQNGASDMVVSRRDSVNEDYFGTQGEEESTNCRLDDQFDGEHQDNQVSESGNSE